MTSKNETRLVEILELLERLRPFVDTTNPEHEAINNLWREARRIALHLSKLVTVELAAYVTPS